jgi:multicomponent Na+:H+ antiporter subunit F
MEIYETVQNVTLIVLLLSLGFAFARLVRGPSLADRVVALDSMAIIFVAVIAVYSIKQNQPVFLDAGILLAIIAFLGTVAFSRYLEKRITK